MIVRVHADHGRRPTAPGRPARLPMTYTDLAPGHATSCPSVGTDEAGNTLGARHDGAVDRRSHRRRHGSARHHHPGGAPAPRRPSPSRANEPGVTFECQLTKNKKVTKPWAPCDAHDDVHRLEGGQLRPQRARDGRGRERLDGRVLPLVDRAGCRVVSWRPRPRATTLCGDRDDHQSLPRLAGGVIPHSRHVREGVARVTCGPPPWPRTDERSARVSIHVASPAAAGTGTGRQ